MGPSGAGKTTWLLTLNAIAADGRPGAINGEDLYAIYDALRGSIGYVPQDDIVHPSSRVGSGALQREIPPATRLFGGGDRGRVRHTLAQLGLESVAHLQIGRPERKSFGWSAQRGTSRWAGEDPVIMFLDEPTSAWPPTDTRRS